MIPDPHAYAAELRGIRRFLSLSVRDVAGYLHTDARAVNRWESGRAPVPPSVMDAMRLLEREMQARVDRGAVNLHTAPPGPITLMRDRDELDAREPFFRDKPEALHEWEAAQLARRTGRALVFSAQYRETHAPRSPYSPSRSILEGDTAGRQRFTADADVAEPLRRVADGHLAPATVPTARDALALIEVANVDWFTLADDIGYDLIQPWPDDLWPLAYVKEEYDGARAEGTYACLILLLTPGDDSTTPYVLEVAGIRFGRDDDPELKDFVWADGIPERMPPTLAPPSRPR